MGGVSRPCKYCLAAYPILFEDGDISSCEFEHRDERRIYDLALAMARVFQARTPSDEQVQWFLGDADAVVDDFDPQPERWRIRRLPDGKNDDFVMRFRINDVTYVIQDGDEKMDPVRLSTLRQWQREADEAAGRRSGIMG